MNIKKIRVSEETLFKTITFILMVAVLSATYYAVYCNEYVFHNSNPLLNGLSVILSFVSMAFTLIFCTSLL